MTDRVRVDSPTGTVEGTGTGSPTVLVAHGPGAPARVAADLLVAWLAGAIAARGVAHLALSGGSSAPGLCGALRAPERARAIDWGRVHAWLGDDRFVPIEHPDCNAGTALRDLVAGGSGPLPRANLHPIPVERAIAAGLGPAEAAAWYAAELVATLPIAAGLPVFDVVVLGAGADGHLLSVFPWSAALAADTPVAVGVAAPTHIAPHVARVTLAPSLLGVAGHLLPIVVGAAKADVVARIFGSVRDPRRWPAQLALRPSATWILDPASAGGLDLGGPGHPHPGG